MKIASLLEKMSPISDQYPPPVVSLVLLFLTMNTLNDATEKLLGRALVSGMREKSGRNHERIALPSRGRRMEKGRSNRKIIFTE